LIAYVEQIAHGGEVNDAIFIALEKYFSPQGITEPCSARKDNTSDMEK
jgi:hypothetical protein